MSTRSPALPVSTRRRSGGSPTPKLLIVNADDFGLSEGICRAILRAHQSGIVTSTSVLAVGKATGRAAAALADHPRLAVGAHLAAVGKDPPLLSRREIPTLVGRDGHLPRTWSEFVHRVIRGAVDTADLHREFAAQLVHLRGLGLSPGHLDTHMNIHLWPPVGRVLVDLAVAHAIPALRVPQLRRPTPLGAAVTVLECRLLTAVARAGLHHPGRSVGLGATAQLHGRRLERSLWQLAASRVDAVELVVHPGTYAARALELAAVTSSACRQMVDGLGLSLGTYADLAAETLRPCGQDLHEVTAAGHEWSSPLSDAGREAAWSSSWDQGVEWE